MAFKDLFTSEMSEKKGLKQTSDFYLFSSMISSETQNAFLKFLSFST